MPNIASHQFSQDYHSPHGSQMKSYGGPNAASSSQDYTQDFPAGQEHPIASPKF